MDKENERCLALVTHAYNPIYLGGRDQEASQVKASPGK
jgi:hypothetical protein